MTDLLSFIVAGIVAGFTNAIFNQIGLHLYHKYVEHHVRTIDTKAQEGVARVKESLTGAKG